MMPTIQGSQTSAALASMITPEPKGIAELVKLMREDYQVKLAEITLTSNSKSAKVTVTADGDEPGARELAEHLTKLWYRRLPAMLECVAYGRAAFEKVLAYTGGQNRYEDLKPLPFELTEMILEKDGQDKGAFLGVLLKGKVPSENVTLSPVYSWWLALDAAPLQPHGVSRFTGAPWKSFSDRRKVLRLREIFVRKFIFQGGIAHTPDTVQIDGEAVDVMPHLLKAWDELAAGGIMRLPNNRVVDSEGKPVGYEWDFDKVAVDMTSAAPLLEVINAMDAEQLLAFGIPPKTVIEGDAVGSFALVTQQMLILLSVVEDIVNQIVESFQRYVVDPIAKMNGFASLTVNFTPLTNRPDDLASELVKQWLTTPQLSPILLSGAVDILAVFEAVGVALSADAKQRLDAMLQSLRSVTPQPSPTVPTQANLSPPFLLGTRA